MKKLAIAICAFGLSVAMVSCGTANKTTANKGDINGEWSITEVDGNAVDASKSEKDVFMAFDVAAKKMHGCAGCNNIFGGIDIDTDKGTISFANTAATRMMCADMKTEDSVLSALSKVKGFKFEKDGTLTLTSDGGKAEMKLKKRNK